MPDRSVKPSGSDLYYSVMLVLTTAEMREADRRTIEEIGIPGRVLMESAGRAVVRQMTRVLPDLRSQRIEIVCGKGNNGGDGLVVLRALATRGFSARAWVLSNFEGLSGDAKANLEAALELDLPVQAVPDESAWNDAVREITEAEVVVDAILGTGLTQAARGLAAAAERRGARIHAHSEVMHWHKQGDGSHLLETAHGSLRAKQVILTGNGFMPEHLHRGVKDRPLPVQSAIVVTRTMSEAELQQKGWHTENPTINSKHMFFYYRLLSDRRFMLGGRANHIGDPAGAEQTFRELKLSIARMWPQFADIEYTHQWRGLVCFALNLRPSIGRMPEDKSVFFAYGYHGNGVNSATWSGRELARWLAGENSGDSLLPTHLPAIIRGRPPKFPLAFLRRQYVRAGLSFYNLRDRFNF